MRIPNFDLDIPEGTADRIMASQSHMSYNIRVFETAQDKMGTTLLHTKLLPSRVDRRLVERPSLIDQLNHELVKAGASGGVVLPELADVDVSDGLFDLYLITRELRPIRAVSHYALNVGNFQAGIYHWQGREITLETDSPQSVWIDGEEYGQIPIMAKVLPKALEVVVP